MFCVSVLGYRYKCFKFITAPMIYDRGRKRERVLCYINYVFALLCDHCSHFYMTVLVYDQVAHMFHNIFT